MKKILKFISTTIKVFGYLFVIGQFMNYFSPYGQRSYESVNGELKAVQIENLTYFVLRPIGYMINGNFEIGLVQLISVHILLLSGIILIYNKSIAKITINTCKYLYKKFRFHFDINRFNNMNLGMRRLLLVISIPSSLFFGAIFGDEMGRGLEEQVLFIISSPIFFITFWLTIRLIYWIYDGFHENK